MSRLTRNNAVASLNLGVNKEQVGKGSNIPVMAKRKTGSSENVPAKRAALGDLTNARGVEPTSKGGKNAGLGKGGKDASSNAAMKKISGMLKSSKGSLALRGKEPKKTVAKKGTVVAALKKEEEASSTSSSSEEGLLCVFSDPETSSEEKVVDVKLAEPSWPVMPEGVEDFDRENAGDPQQHSDYAMETFQYYKNREETFRVPDYLQSHHEINENMRGILVDWLVEVQESFELNHETLYTAVKMVDLYLSKKQVKKEDLQLIGAVTCLIACKVDERIPPMVDDFLYVCDDAYTRERFMVTERKVLSVVGFDVGFPLSYRYLRRYGRVCHISMPVLTLARYILELSLMEYRLNVEISESEVAVAALVLALKMKNIEGWAATLKYYSSVDFTKAEPIVQKMLVMLQQPQKESMKTIHAKYSHKVFHEVALTPVPTSVTLTSEG